MLHILPTNVLLLAAKQERYKKYIYISLNEKYWKNFFGKVQQNGAAGRKKKTERVVGLGRSLLHIVYTPYTSTDPEVVHIYTTCLLILFQHRPLRLLILFQHRPRSGLHHIVNLSYTSKDSRVVYTTLLTYPTLA